MNATVARWVEAHYGLEAVQCTAVAARARNALARVESRQGAFWLRVATGERVRLEIAEAEAKAVAALAGRGLRVAAPHGVDGQFARPCLLFGEPGPALLFREAEGAQVTTPSVAQAEALGRLVGRINDEPLPGASLASARQIDRSHLADGPLECVAPWLRTHDIDVAPLRAIADEVAALVEWGPAVLCHGDIHAENARFAGKGPTLFDFEAWGLGPPAYDAACFWRKHVHADQDAARAAGLWAGFLRGHGGLGAPGGASALAVCALATLRAIWVMGLPAAAASRWGGEWLRDREYFEAHVERIVDLARSTRAANQRNATVTNSPAASKR